MDRRERGAAAVEMAIVLPLLLLVIGGIVDFGRAFFTEIALTNAAREGVRAAVISTATAAQVQTRAQNSAPGVTLATGTNLQLCPGAEASVTAESTFDWIMLGPVSNLFGGAITLPPTLSATARMKCGG